jgi:hypothetical protein
MNMAAGVDMVGGAIFAKVDDCLVGRRAISLIVGDRIEEKGLEAVAQELGMVGVDGDRLSVAAGGEFDAGVEDQQALLDIVGGSGGMARAFGGAELDILRPGRRRFRPSGRS